MVGKDSKAYVKKSSSSYEPFLVGIVSTEPSRPVMGDFFEENEFKVPVALAGRVPVKIDPNSQPISAGDSLTSSPTPGYATKATQAGPTIGKALEDWNHDSGKTKIIVFVNVSWYDPAVLVDADGDIAEINEDGSTSKIIVSTVEAEEGVFEKLTITVEAVFASVKAQTLNVTGKLTAKLAEITEAVIEKLTVKTLAIKGDGTGQATIPAGETKAVIESSVVTATSRIFTSPVTPTGGQLLIIGDKVSGTSFEVYIEHPGAADIKFDWWIINSSE